MSNNAQSIQRRDGKFIVPDHPIIPFIEGDGTGPDIWRASVRVFDAAVAKAYGGARSIQWLEVLAGEKAFQKTGSWLPDATLDAFRTHLVGIKGPLTTPVGGGIRSLNVALRQELDLYVCLRPVRYFSGMETPVKRPDLVSMVIFRENTEDIYAGIEFQEGTPEVEQFKKLFAEAFPKLYKKVRFPNTAGIGIKPISREGSERLIRAAIDYAVANNRKSLTLVHKGNIMKFTEGAFRDWGYELAKREYGAAEFDGGPWCKLPGGLVIKDVIADAFLQQILTRPGRLRRHRHAQPERRLYFRRPRGAGRWHRHCARREHQLRDRPRRVRGDAWHGAEIRQPRQGESRLRDSVRRDDAALHGLDRSGRSGERVP